jgi:toxin ParE1/3/4
MPYGIVYKQLAQIEVAEAYAWYADPQINMGDSFLAELERADNYLAINPYLYPCVVGEVRRTNLHRFPYSLYFVIDGSKVSVLSCFHQHRRPMTRDQLLGGAAP